MPSISDFSGYVQKYKIDTVKQLSTTMSWAATMGAIYMRENILEGSPTGTKWHEYKNEANGHEYGARIGNAMAGLGRYPVDPHPGKMLQSVAEELAVFKSSAITSRFGWLDTQEDYFAKQDIGDYSKNGVGMGLINGGDRSMRQFGALVHVSQEFIKAIKEDGYRVTSEEVKF